MITILDITIQILTETWHLLLDSSPYIIFGILVAGLLRMFLSTDYVVKHLGRGKVMPVIKASLLGIPIPLCSCGVLPAAASLRKQGASKGATAAFLISTPESGVDSIAVSWALLDPIMTVARPVVAFVTATVAGLAESLLDSQEKPDLSVVDNGCPVDGCCDGNDCDPEDHSNHHAFTEKISAGMKYAFGELWGDLASWFAFGLLLAGAVTALVPEHLITSALGGGLTSMLIMLFIGVPLYICATASTPIAAALILKGVSPGAALVFLLVGPATNLASLTVLTGLLGKRAVAIYLASIAAVSVAAGLLLDQVYAFSGISAQASVGQAAEMVPMPVQLTASLLLVALSIKPIWTAVRKRLPARAKPIEDDCCSSSCADGLKADS
jgi:uncharacterized membrane protein YraQ (UPF0718 family)